MVDEPIKWLSEIGDINVSPFDIFAAVVAGTLVAALAGFFQTTHIGRALRAVSDDHQAALSVGIPLRKVWGIMWTVRGVRRHGRGPYGAHATAFSLRYPFIALKALPVLILGGFDSIAGAIVGGLIIGASENLAEVFFGPVVGGGLESWFPYVFALAFGDTSVRTVRRESDRAGVDHALSRNRSVQDHLHGRQEVFPIPLDHIGVAAC